MGLMPHTSPQRRVRLGLLSARFPEIQRAPGRGRDRVPTFVPRLYLPVLLQNLGYRTHAMVSLPVLNPRDDSEQGFDTYKLMEQHNDMRAMVRAHDVFPKNSPRSIC